MTALKILVSGTLLVLILRRFSFEELKLQILQTDPSALVLPLVILLVSNVLGALQWSWLLRTAGVGLGVFAAVRLYFVGLFFNNFLFGTLGGDVYKIYSVGKQHQAVGRAASATLVDRMIGVSALCALAVMTAAAALFWGQIPARLALLILVFSIGTMAAAGIVLHPAWGESVQNGLLRLPFGNLSQRLARLMSYLREYRESTRILNSAFALSLLIQAARVLAHFFVGMAMGWPLVAADLGKFFLVIPVLGLIIALPISIGGWGVREWAGIALFAPLGRSGGEAVTLLALTATLTLLVSLLGGVALIARPRRIAATGG
jgi:uncharacterized protein (TIRG00374 family)